MKKIVVIIFLLFGIFMLFGCTDSNSDAKKINQLQEKYGLSTSFVPDEKIMLDYSNELIGLNLASNLADAELYSAQAFYQILVLTKQTMTLDMSKESCKSVSVIKTYQIAKLCETISQNAISKFDLLSSNEKELLRYGQKELVMEYLNTCKKIQDEMKTFCPSLD
ncbi:MAG TPA: hypothetical protein PKK60_00400 [archaeon]|nr:hypothetical protein [archaeon]